MKAIAVALIVIILAILPLVLSRSEVAIVNLTSCIAPSTQNK